MDIILYRCLEAFHQIYTKTDDNPKLKNLPSFTTMMQDDYSGQNLVAKIIDTDIYWNKMLIELSNGQGRKYNKTQDYRRNLIITWRKIKETFQSQNEKDIAKLMGTLLWEIEED